MLAAIAAAAVVTPVASAQSIPVNNHGIPAHPSKFCLGKILNHEKAKAMGDKNCVPWVYEPQRKHIFTIDPAGGGGTVVGHHSLPCENGVCPEVRYSIGGQ